MKSIRIWAFVVACMSLCVVTGCKYIAFDPLAHGWEKLDEAPSENAPILKQAMESPCIWVTTNKGGRIQITDRHSAKTTALEVRLQTPAGMLVGTNNGEYGGNLSLIGKSGLPNKVLLAENVFHLLPLKSGVLVFTSLLHLSVEEGKVWLFYKGDNGDWSVRKIADLDGTPRAVYVRNESALIITSHGISQVNPSVGVERIAPLPFAQTFPNSVTEDAQGRIYIGMNAFVVRLIPTKGYFSEWFTKQDCLR